MVNEMCVKFVGPLHSILNDFYGELTRRDLLADTSLLYTSLPPLTHFNTFHFNISSFKLAAIIELPKLFYVLISEEFVVLEF